MKIVRRELLNEGRLDHDQKTARNLTIDCTLREEMRTLVTLLRAPLLDQAPRTMGLLKRNDVMGADERPGYPMFVLDRLMRNRGRREERPGVPAGTPELPNCRKEPKPLVKGTGIDATRGRGDHEGSRRRQGREGERRNRAGRTVNTIERRGRGSRLGVGAPTITMGHGRGRSRERGRRSEIPRNPWGFIAVTQRSMPSIKHPVYYGMHDKFSR